MPTAHIRELSPLKNSINKLTVGTAVATLSNESQLQQIPEFENSNRGEPGTRGTQNSASLDPNYSLGGEYHSST